MNWGAEDFAFAAVLVVGVIVMYRLASRRTDSFAYRAGAGLALAAGFVLIWANAAVGIIGSENNEANRMFAGVLAVAAIGAVLARFRPSGMARALCATALAQVLVAGIALATGAGAGAPLWPLDLVVVTTFFVTLWLISAWLFRRAAREAPRTGDRPHA